MDTYVSKRLMGSGDTKVVVAAVEKITKENGRLSTKELAKKLVEKSRAKTSPTHHLFEWDDRRAAEAHRLERASAIIAAIHVVFEEQPAMSPVRAFPIVTTQGKSGPYPMRKVLAEKDLTQAMLDRALAELEMFRVRYEGLKDLAEVFGAIERTIGRKRKSA